MAAEPTFTTRPDKAEAETLPRPVSTNSGIVSTAKLWTNPHTVFTKRHLFGDVDPVQSTFPLSAYCFMTGFM